MFLKENRSGKIKGRTVADGNKQSCFISKEDARSPIVETDSVLLTCIIEAQKERDVAVVDIPNAFIQRKGEIVNDMATFRVRRELVDALSLQKCADHMSQSTRRATR